MADLSLKLTKRDILGKKTRFLRRQGITPSHLFGHNIKSLALQGPTGKLEYIIAQAGMTRLINLQIEADKQPKMVFIREIQRDPLSGRLLHIDFYQVSMKERMTADIPIVFVGQAPALKEKGHIVTQLLNHLGVECLPDKLPPQIEVDLSQLEAMGQTIHVSDIALDPEVTVTTEPDQPVVKVTEVAAARIEEEVAVEEAEAAKAVEAEAPTEEEAEPTSS
ncbi:hypothetical protein ES703_124674 [subsurface metagenome]